MKRLTMLENGYKTFRRGGLRVQLYYPCIRLRDKDYMIKVQICFRVAWGKYKAVALACGFGLGFDYEAVVNNEEVIE